MAIGRSPVPVSCCGVSPGGMMLGDRPDTDIEGARRLGMWTALVRTGRFSPGAALGRDGPPPDYDVNDLPALIGILERVHPGVLGR